MNCKECGKRIKRSYGGMCEGCYRYFHDGGMVHPLPPKGTIERDENGKVICHICGRSYTRLGSHAKESHGMNIAEYKERFGLCASSHTTEADYSRHMSDLAYKHEMPQQLKRAGAATRIKKGDTTMRKGKQLRLQELIMMRSRGNNMTHKEDKDEKRF